MARRRIYAVVAGVSLLGAASWRTEAAASTGSEIKAEGRSLRRRAAATRRWRDDHGDDEGRDTDVRTRDSADGDQVMPMPPPSIPALVCSRIYRDVTHVETTRTDGSEGDGLLSPTYGQRPENAGELVEFNSVAIGPTAVTDETLFGPCSEHCDVLCSEMLNGGVKDLCLVFSCDEYSNSCSAVTKCPPSLPDNPDGYCNPETGECGREGIGLVSPDPPTGPEKGVGLISTATTASSCNQDAFLPIDIAKEKRKLKRARKRWRLASAKRPYSYRVSEKGSPFYRSTKKKTKIEKVFSEINHIFKKVELYYNFSIIYNRKTGYPKTVRLGYILPEDPRCVDIDLRIQRLRFSRPVDPCDPINQLQFDVIKARATLNANQLKFDELQDYTYTISRSCFCPEEFRGPFVVTVLGGEISSATYEGTTQPVDHSIPTIAELFDLINDACTTPAARLNVEYNSEMGYPTSLYIDHNECIADEETSYTISDLKKTADIGSLGEQGNDCDESTFDADEAQASLASNQLKFAEVQDYDYTLSRGCFCPPEREGPFRVSVRGNNITAATYKETGLPVDLVNGVRPPTIPGLYEIIKRGIDRPYFELSVTYDVDLGYPEQIVYNVNKCISDAQGKYIVSDLEIRTNANEQIRECDKQTYNTDEAQAALVANKLKFGEVQDYNFKYQVFRGALVPPELSGPFSVSVRNGNITSATNKNTNLSVDPEQYSIQTISDLYSLIDDAIARPASGLEVTYNAIGYPERIYIDTIGCLYDDEVTYLASDLVVVPGPDEEGTPQDDCMDPKPTFNVPKAVSDLATNQKKFNDLQDYDYTFSRSCFCPPNTSQGPFRVSVRLGNVTVATRIDTGESVDPKSVSIKTIAQIFDIINGAFTAPTFGLEVTYNSEKGFPETIYVDKYACMADEEISLAVSNLADRTPQIGGPGPGLTFTRPLDEAKENQEKWDAFLAATGSKSYIFTYREDSLFEKDQTITVIGGTPEKASAFNNGFSLVPIDIESSRAIQSVEDAFTLLVETLKVGQGVTPLIQYDPKQGNPTRVSLSFVSGDRAGERILFTISDIKLLPTDDGCPGNTFLNKKCPNEGLSCYQEAGCCVESRRVSSKCDCRFGRWECGYTDICMPRPDDENRTEPPC